MPVPPALTDFNSSVIIYCLGLTFLCQRVMRKNRYVKRMMFRRRGGWWHKLQGVHDDPYFLVCVLAGSVLWGMLSLCVGVAMWKNSVDLQLSELTENLRQYRLLCEREKLLHEQCRVSQE